MLDVRAMVLARVPVNPTAASRAGTPHRPVGTQRPLPAAADPLRFRVPCGVLPRVFREVRLAAGPALHADGWRLPKFVEQEFRDFLTCGVLTHGFARLRCIDCAFERLVPFSCKGRGLCPSCGGRRMTEYAARLVDDVLPRVPVRQRVFSLPHRLRDLLAWDHALSRVVLGVYVRVLLGFQRLSPRSGPMPRESLGAPEDCPKRLRVKCCRAAHKLRR